MALYEAKDYEASAREFQTAYAIKQLPRLILNLGQVYRKMGRAKEALGYYELYLRLEPNPKPELRSELDGYISQLRTMITAAEHAKTELDNSAPSADPPITDQKPLPSPAPVGEPPPAMTPAPAVAPPVAPAAPVSATVSASTPAPKPVERRKTWPIWLGVGIGVVVVSAVAIGLGVGLTRRSDDNFWTARPIP